MPVQGIAVVLINGAIAGILFLIGQWAGVRHPMAVVISSTIGIGFWRISLEFTTYPPGFLCALLDKDRAEIISDNVTMKTPTGTFKNCIKVKEISGLDPNDKCYKTYAPGVGLIQDEDLLLTNYSKQKQ